MSGLAKLVDLLYLVCVCSCALRIGKGKITHKYLISTVSLDVGISTCEQVKIPTKTTDLGLKTWFWLAQVGHL